MFSHSSALRFCSSDLPGSTIQWSCWLAYFGEDELSILVDGQTVVNDDHFPLPVLTEPNLVGPDLWTVLLGQHNVFNQLRTLGNHS